MVSLLGGYTLGERIRFRGIGFGGYVKGGGVGLSLGSTGCWVRVTFRSWFDLRE